MNGKQKCKILKEIRAEIARNNDIEYVTSECKHKGDCAGTCPKCEAELRYLEKELEKRRRLGKTVAIAGLTASVTLAAAGCVDPFVRTAGDMQPPETVEQLMGDILPIDTGDLPVETVGEVVEELDGDITEEFVKGLLEFPDELVEGELVAEPPLDEETDE